MPQLIHTITSYFFEKKRDLYFIRFNVPRNVLGFTQEESLDAIPGRDELLAWLSDNMPHVEKGPIFTFKDDSGVIAAPYDGSIYVDFSDEDNRKYCAEWEDANNVCKDPRWQCYVYPLEDYMAEYGGRIPDPEEFVDF